MAMSRSGQLSGYPTGVPKETDDPLLYEDDSGGEYEALGDGMVGYFCRECEWETHDCNCNDDESTGEASNATVDGIEEDVLTLADAEQDLIKSYEQERRIIAAREQVIRNICSGSNSNIGDVGDYCTCAICHDIMKDAKSLNCGHTFCDGCIQQYRDSEGSSNLCPTCRTAIIVTHPNYVVRNIIESMKGINNNKNADQTYQPCFMGMSDKVLEQILHYVSDEPSKLCMLETTCKRVCSILHDDNFWARNSFIFPSVYNWVNFFGDDTRKRSGVFHYNGIEMIKKYQMGFCQYQMGFVSGTGRTTFPRFRRKNHIQQLNVIEEDMLLDVLGGADAFRDVVAHLVSCMVYCGSVHIRLRGDAVGYLTQMMQGYIVKKLESALEIAINCGRTEVQREDVHFAFKTQEQFLFGCTSKPFSKCNVGSKEHNVTGHALGCSCNIPSSSGSVWRWPDGDCHDALPKETGRRIVRRLAYEAGILRMTSDAFVLIEAEILHSIGTLVAHAYELSYNEANAAEYLDEDKELVYDESRDGIDMYVVPPPPMHIEGNESDYELDIRDVYRTPTERIYTIVPGKIRAAAEERGITKSIVYGNTWETSADFTEEEERETEKSYYYQPFDVNDEETSEEIDAEDNTDDMSEDSISLTSEENDHILNRSDYVDWDWV